jgi:hypothetical protein
MAQLRTLGTENRRTVLKAMASGLLAISPISKAHPQAKNRAMLKSIQLSSDGKLCALHYQAASATRRGLAVFDIANRRLTPIGTTFGGSLSFPSFSPDGSQLVVIIDNEHIGLVDLSTFRLHKITRDPVFPSFPVFQPITNNILYITKREAHISHIRLLDLRTGTENTILDPANGFGVSIGRLSFLDENQFVFQASGPRDPILKNIVTELTGSNVAHASYSLVFGGVPQLFFPDILSPKLKAGQPQITSLSVSARGRVIFIGQSETKPHVAGLGFNYDIFEIKEERPVALTSVADYIALAHIARGGSAVGFGWDATRTRDFDLCVLDLESLAVRSTGLRELMRARVDL